MVRAKLHCWHGPFAFPDTFPGLTSNAEQYACRRHNCAHMNVITTPATIYRQLRGHLAELKLADAAWPPGSGLGTSAADLAARCHRATFEGKGAPRMRFFAGPTLLIIDELGHLPLPGEAASALFQVINRRYLKTSIVITTSGPVEAWGEILGDTTVAAAMLDRLLHRSVVVTRDRASYRLRQHATDANELRRATTGTNLR